MLKKTKGQSGITLVALVVTIVVLLILAGITIALVFAQNGVVGKAQEAAKESNKGTITFTLGGQSYNFTAYNNGYPTLEAASTTVGP